MTNLATAPYPSISACACASLRQATRVVTQAYDGALRPVGLRSTQFTLLGVLARRGQMRQSQLADILKMDGTTLTRNLRPMLNKGWIRIDRDTDQRVRLVSATAAGRKVLDQAMPLWRQAQANLSDKLGATRWSDLLESLAVTADAATSG